MNADEGKLVAMGRAEIDTRAPFRSVKEAVLLFGERVLVREIYANKIKEIGAAGASDSIGHAAQPKIEVLTAELEETKQNLTKVREENKLMAYCIKSLRDDLERAKKELHNTKYLKAIRDGESDKHTVDPEIEEENHKFIENGETKFETKAMLRNPNEEDFQSIINQKKRYVKFASPPAHEIVHKEDLQERFGDAKKTKNNNKKTLMHLIGRVLSKNKAIQKGGWSPRA